MLGIRLRVAVHCCEVYLVGLLYLGVSMLDQHALAASFRAHNQEVLVVVHPFFKTLKVALSHGSLKYGTIL